MSRAALFGLFLSIAGLASERYDHRGSVGLLLSGSTGVEESTGGPSRPPGSDRLLDAEIGGSLAIGVDGDEVIALWAFDPSGPGARSLFHVDYRSYFGADRFKTFLDLGGQVELAPSFSLGPRAAIGVQYEVLSVLGAFAGLGLRAGWGNALTFGFEGFAGLQLRSYLLE